MITYFTENNSDNICSKATFFIALPDMYIQGIRLIHAFNMHGNFSTFYENLRYF